MVLDVDFQIEHNNNTALVEVFLNSESEEVYKLIEDISPYADLLPYINYIPYYLTFPKFGFEENVKVLDRKVDDACLGGGKYCARPFYSFEMLDQLSVIKENILQKCLWMTAKESGNLQSYFDYIIYFYNSCYKGKDSQGKSRFTVECGKAQMSRTSIKVSNVEKCYANSFVLPENINPSTIVQSQNILDNQIFDNDNAKKQDLNVRIMPSLFINGKQFWGAYEKRAVLEAICSGLLKKPDICYKEGGFILNNTSNRKVWKMYFLAVLLVLGISLIIFVVCKKYMFKQVDDKLSESDIDLKVNTVVTSYLALKDKQ